MPFSQLRACVHAICLYVSIKTERAAWRCCDTVPILVCVCGVLFCLWSYIVLARSSALPGWWEPALIQACNLSEQPPPPLHPQFVSCSYTDATANWDAGQTWQKQTLLLQRPMHIILLPLRINQSGISDIDTDYSDFNFPINNTLPVLAVCELSTRTVEFCPSGMYRYSQHTTSFNNS